MKSNIDATNQTRWRTQRRIGVGAPHAMAWHLGGNPQGEPWLLLHGGPGSGANPGLMAPLDLARHRAIAPDQRGCGESRPRGATQRNHTAALVRDLEQLRERLGLARWSVLAGSWGSVLALAYARAHPTRVDRLVLRGAFALTQREIAGLLRGQGYGQTLSVAGLLWPQSGGVPMPALLARLRQLFQGGTPSVAGLRAARRWALCESRAAAHGMWKAWLHASRPAPPLRQAWGLQRRRERRLAAEATRRPGVADRRLLDRLRIQRHYLAHRGFLRPGALDRAVMSLAHQGIRVDWVHGRHDAVCPPRNSRRWAAMGARIAPDRVSLSLTGAGHLGHEPATLAALRDRVRAGA
ncbi:MAG: alpha/beta fold hydrolase [Hydrogenophaga sp.]|nr:alpha/beta fold hydrolase [Hydrogenophaga sp.]